jgi:hypothetical protein
MFLRAASFYEPATACGERKQRRRPRFQRRARTCHIARALPMRAQTNLPAFQRFEKSCCESRCGALMRSRVT